METLLNTDFFKQIKNENNANIQKAYTDFVKKLLSFCKSEGDHISIYFTLNYTRIEFISIQNGIIECKSKKK
ncbi:MAG: hypothetical protein ACK5KT_16280 [Dysgonomonas sp.]